VSNFQSCKVACGQPWAIASIFYIMKPKDKGLSNDDIEKILNFDWDVSTDEESGDELEDIFLQCWRRI